MGNKVKNGFKRMLVLVMALSLMLSGAIVTSVEASAKSKKVIIKSLEDNSMEYYKAMFATEYLGDDIEWENIIGVGKAKKIKVSDKAKYAIMDYNKMKAYKVTKEEFLNVLDMNECGKNKEKGKIWYWGMACKLTIKNNEVVKITQLYQS